MKLTDAQNDLVYKVRDMLSSKSKQIRHEAYASWEASRMLADICDVDANNAVSKFQDHNAHTHAYVMDVIFQVIAKHLFPDEVS